jgi:hypothetical protein
MRDWCEFRMSDSEQMAALAQITAEWVRQGICFKMEVSFDGISVMIKTTGGF